MASETIISATFGVPGAGKTYSRVKWLVDDFLINNPSGMYITNIPIDIPVISAYVSKIKNCSYDEIACRLHIIPDDIMISWEKLNQLDNRDLQTFDAVTFPPSAYLQQFNLEGAHIAIDEFHKYFSKKGPKSLRKLWNDWFAEIRKTGCVFEAITQSYGQMSEEFLDKCATRLELVNHSELRDPFFGVRMGDWYELRAGIIGKSPVQRVSEKETMQGTSVSGRLCWVPTGRGKTFVLQPEYFKFYNSFRNYTGSSAERKPPSAIYGKAIIFWFLRRNLLNIVPRILIVILVGWFLLGGGLQFCIKCFFSTFNAVGKSNSSVRTSAKSNNIVPVRSVPIHEGKNVSSAALKKSGFVSKNKEKSSGSDSDQKVKTDLSVEIDGFRPALFWQDILVLKNGLEFKLGDKITVGVFNGKKIVLIDKKKRFYQLDDGTCLYMFYGLQLNQGDKTR